MLFPLQVGGEVAQHLKDSGVEVKEYGAVLDDVEALAQTHTQIWADPAKVHCDPMLPVIGLLSEASRGLPRRSKASLALPGKVSGSLVEFSCGLLSAGKAQANTRVHRLAGGFLHGRIFRQEGFRKHCVHFVVTPLVLCWQVGIAMTPSCGCSL